MVAVSRLWSIIQLVFFMFEQENTRRQHFRADGRNLTQTDRVVSCPLAHFGAWSDSNKAWSAQKQNVILQVASSTAQVIGNHRLYSPLGLGQSLHNDPVMD
jgi:hypothetical protein